MSLRTALGNSVVLTFGVGLVGLWVLLVGIDIAGTLGSLAANGYVGPGLVSGLAGLAVIGGFLALVVVLYGEVGEVSPAPGAWQSEK
jgi:lipopolysaccharide export LptBFGC system permease protein LptF